MSDDIPYTDRSDYSGYADCELCNSPIYLQQGHNSHHKLEDCIRYMAERIVVLEDLCNVKREDW